MIDTAFCGKHDRNSSQGHLSLRLNSLLRVNHVFYCLVKVRCFALHCRRKIVSFVCGFECCFVFDEIEVKMACEVFC